MTCQLEAKKEKQYSKALGKAIAAIVEAEEHAARTPQP
jgi:hypothetical protein